MNDFTLGLFGDNMWVWGLWDLGIAAVAIWAAYSLLGGGEFGRVIAYLWAMLVIVNSFLIIGIAPWFAAAMITPCDPGDLRARFDTGAIRDITASQTLRNLTKIRSRKRTRAPAAGQLPRSGQSVCVPVSRRRLSADSTRRPLLTDAASGLFINELR